MKSFFISSGALPALIYVILVLSGQCLRKYPEQARATQSNVRNILRILFGGMFTNVYSLLYSNHKHAIHVGKPGKVVKSIQENELHKQPDY